MLKRLTAKDKLAAQLAPPTLKRQPSLEINKGVNQSQGDAIHMPKIKPSTNLWKLTATQKFKAAAILSNKGLKKAKVGKHLKLDIVSLREMLYARGYGRPQVLTTIYNPDKGPPQTYMKSPLPRLPNYWLKESTKFEYDAVRMKIEHYLDQNFDCPVSESLPNVKVKRNVKLLPPLQVSKEIKRKQPKETLLSPSSTLRNMNKMGFHEIGSEPLSHTYDILRWLNRCEERQKLERQKEIERMKKKEELMKDSLFYEEHVDKHHGEQPSLEKRLVPVITSKITE